jgi:hypothetical protein
LSELVAWNRSTAATPTREIAKNAPAARDQPKELKDQRQRN